MDFCRNVSVPSELQPPEQHFPSNLDDLFSGHHTEEGDLNMEWLSIFVEDCLSSSGNCLPPALAVLPSGATPTAPCTTPAAARNTSPTTPLGNSLPLDKFAVPGKARSKRKRTPNLQKTPFRRTNCWYRPPPQGEDPPLLQQVHWLADSELIQLPEYKKKGGKCGNSSRGMKEEGSGGSNNGHGQLGMRRCSHCLSQRTPQWRAGPLGPKTLCNACGVRYKSGRLLPEYRPAKSPTFVSHKHSNSHKKVLEMRMSLLSSPPNSNSLL